MRKWTVLAAVLGAGVLGGAALRTRQPGAATASAPTRVAIVNVDALLKGSKEWDDRNNETKAKMDGYVEELKKLKQEVDALKVRLDKEVPRTDMKQFIQVRTQLVEKGSLMDARDKSYQDQVNLERGIALEGVYAKARAAIAAIAKRDGYDLVLFDDTSFDVNPNSGFTAVQGSIASKRVLFASDAIDITARVLTAMNNDYAAGGGEKGPAPSVGGSPRIEPKGKK